MLKLSDPVSPSSRFRTPFPFRERAQLYEAERSANAARFLAEANRIVDTILDPNPSALSAEPPRFVHLTPVRFGRTRLFLSKFIGRIAWRGVGLWRTSRRGKQS